MIYISHTKADKPLVEPIAQKIAGVFGQENVFYDSWSIQPGDGIIDRLTRDYPSVNSSFLCQQEQPQQKDG